MFSAKGISSTQTCSSYEHRYIKNIKEKLGDKSSNKIGHSRTFYSQICRFLVVASVSPVAYDKPRIGDIRFREIIYAICHLVIASKQQVAYQGFVSLWY